MPAARHRRLAAVLAVVLVASAACSGSDDDPTPAATTPTTTDLFAEVDLGADDPAVEAALDRLEDSGFEGVVLIDDRGDVVVRGMGLADREGGVANDGTTVFDIGSLTKQFTAAAILRLQMDGRLAVQDTLGQYLDGLPPLLSAITLHQLLTHTAGLVDSLGDDGEPIDRDEYVRRVARTALVRRPGTGYGYSNVGYSLLAAVIEVVTGRSYEAYLHDALFEPAGMSSTGYVLPDVDRREVAVGYVGDEAVGRPNEQPWADDGPWWNLRGNGGILSTAEDMYRWHLALLGDDILDEDAKAELYARHTREGPGADTWYGYGWSLVPTGRGGWLVTHNGGNGVFFADLLRFLDDDVTIFLASNAARRRDEDAAYRLAAAILDPTG